LKTFSSVSSVYSFDIVNSGTDYLMLMIEPSTSAKFSPNVIRISPGTRKTVVMSVGAGVKLFKMSYAVSRASTPFKTHSGRYRAYSDGETVMCVPVAVSLYTSLKSRAQSIFEDSKILVTDSSMPSGTYIYTPGPYYRRAGVFARDLLYQLEGGGRDMVTADEVKRAVDFMASKQLTANKTVGAYTYPKGAIPDHVYPDGRYSWGPGVYYGDTPGHFNRPSMDAAMCFITLAWHYGAKSNWDTSWRSWFAVNKQRFEDAWNSVPRNPTTGLVTQWTTSGHTGANGITETNGPCVMWGFHDSYGFPGDDVGTSVLACNAARALVDMYGRVSDHTSAKT